MKLSSRSFFSRLPAVFLTGLLAMLPLSCRGEDAYPNQISIGEIRGAVPPAGDATGFRARLNQETVVVRGLVHQLLSWQSHNGEDNFGMLIQNLPADADDNPDTSDGLFVYLGRSPALPLQPQGDYEPKAGDLVTLRGKVNERYGQTELSEASVLAVRAAVGDPDKLLPRQVLSLPRNFNERQRVLEKLEGMRVSLPAGAVAVSGTQPHYRTRDTQLWVVPPTHPVATREDPAARRLYRPVHPLSAVPENGRNEADGRFLVIGSLGLVERLEDRDKALPPVYAGSRLKDAVTGGIHYSWGEYLLQTDRVPEFADNERPVPGITKPDADAPGLRVAAYNVENLYDFVDDPFDDCDFHDDDGCPGVRKPFNYVPESGEVFRGRIRKIARQIVEEMYAPDILMIQEAEDQDLGKIVNGLMVYGDRNNADGATDVLQELALEIAEIGGPRYRVLVDRNGADYRGIICAWMVKSDHLRPADPAAFPQVFGENPELPEKREWLPMSRNIANPKAFNAVFTGTPDNASEMVAVFSRAVQVLLLEDTRRGRRIWMLNNHFSSGPNRHVDRRAQQAEINAEISELILRIDPGAVLITGGDLNVFPRPDDPLDPPSDQLASLYEAGLFNVADQLMKEDPARSYSYIYKGVVNILDHFFLSEEAKKRLRSAAYLKLNAGAPESFSGEAPLRASDHDPLLIELEW